MTVILRPGQRIINIPGYGVQTSRRAVSSGNGLLNNLVAYWSLNEAGGANNALDLHTNGLTLTQTASPGSAAGKVYAGARTFDGSTQYFSRASESLLQTGDVDFTLAAWVYLTDKTNAGIIVGKSRVTGDSNELFLAYSAASDRLRFIVYRSNTGVIGAANSFGSPPASTWLLVTAWHNSAADTINISVNDGTIDSTATGGAIDSGTGTFRIGARDLLDFVNPWWGRIGPVAMWKSAAGLGGVLTAAQRTALWNAGAGLPYASFTV